MFFPWKSFTQTCFVIFLRCTNFSKLLVPLVTWKKRNVHKSDIKHLKCHEQTSYPSLIRSLYELQYHFSIRSHEFIKYNLRAYQFHTSAWNLHFPSQLHTASPIYWLNTPKLVVWLLLLLIMITRIVCIPSHYVNTNENICGEFVYKIFHMKSK